MLISNALLQSHASMRTQFVERVVPGLCPASEMPDLIAKRVNHVSEMHPCLRARTADHRIGLASANDAGTMKCLDEL